MLRAPSPLSAAAASVTVPAVSIMSSGTRQSLSATSPTTFTTSATFADGRRLSMIASEAFSRFANPRAILAERSEEHTSELQSHHDLVCRLLLEKKKKKKQHSRGTISTSCTDS